MNIAQTKQIDIVDFLKAIGCFPTRKPLVRHGSVPRIGKI